MGNAVESDDEYDVYSDDSIAVFRDFVGIDGEPEGGS